MTRKLFFIGWIIFAISLFLYSYTQVDLSLTLSRLALYQSIEKQFQYIGYFNRPLSTYLYIGIATYGFLLYGFSLKWIFDKKIDEKEVWIISIIIALILLFSYNAFSYDIFNYIFDAKIATYYHKNPYMYRALDFPADPMLLFMRWTHRVYPYGPAWLILTIPLSFLGFNYFIITLFLFKGLAVLSYIVSVFFIQKIAQKTKVVFPAFAMAVFAANPLVIIESLVSAHNDIVMIAFALLSIYFLFARWRIVSLLVLLFSIGIKFATAFLIPAYIYYFLQKKKINYESFFLIAVVFSGAAIIGVSLRTNFQPWYLLYTLPFAAFLSNKKYILIAAVIISVGAVAQYIPYLYTGGWNAPTPIILNWILFSSVFLSVIINIWILLRKIG